MLVEQFSPLMLFLSEMSLVLSKKLTTAVIIAAISLSS